ncbi:hypothetical protein AB2M62_18210 [Sphingomonas sp. MMS12-HWE2-04]|uniref:hypothetical protein n=1 Tax=Sphingomonas sp. MMS12-HWE2-04 TaxID=3234199 RepID=UPI00385153B7
MRRAARSTAAMPSVRTSTSIIAGIGSSGSSPASPSHGLSSSASCARSASFTRVTPGSLASPATMARVCASRAWALGSTICTVSRPSSWRSSCAVAANIPSPSAPASVVRNSMIAMIAIIVRVARPSSSSRRSGAAEAKPSLMAAPAGCAARR